MNDRKLNDQAGALPESFVPATWRGTTGRPGAAYVGVSFDLVGGGVVRLAVTAESARGLMESLWDCLEGAKAGGEAFDMSTYYGDDYDRMGCRVVVDVTKFGYGLTVFSPNGARLETYMSAASPAAISRMLREWCEGKVPRIRDKADQSPSSGS